jgi:CubicO group peptidase (beta-lactamase class C family)
MFRYTYLSLRYISKSTIMKFFITLVCTFLFLQNASSQKEVIPSFVKDSMDSYMQKALADWNIPGVSIAIVKDGKVILSKGYGVRDVDTKIPVDENTLFMIGSNSKAFTAVAVAMLDADKKLSLDDKVTKWIPEFKLNNKAAGEQTIIRDLLCHRIGFKTFQGDFTYWTSNLTRKEVIATMGRIKAEHPFRTTWGYCNAAFLTAGEVIPKASGLQWEDYITKNIFTPLGMTNTLALSKDLPNAANKTTPYTQELDGKLVKIPYCSIDNLAPAGSISSSAADMIKWIGALLNNGKVNDTKVIAPAAIRETWFPHAIIGNANSLGAKRNFSLYGLGFSLDDYEGRKMVSHDGGVNGYVSSVTLLPSEKLGFVVLTNTDQNAFFQAMRYQLSDAFLGLPYKNYSTLFNQYMAANRKKDLATENKMKDSVALKLPTALALQNYTGNYFNEVYGNMKVVVENNQLRMHFSRHLYMYADLQSLGGNRFYVTFTDPALGKAIFPFTVVNGKVKGVTVKVADFVEMDPYEFVKQ